MTESASAPRIIFIDVDGTILEHGSVIAPSTVRAIRAARSAGHTVLLCTGRSDGDVHPDVRAIGFDGAITNGGARVEYGDEVIVDAAMPRADVERLIEFFTRHDVHFFLQGTDAVFASDGIQRFAAGFMQQRRAQRADDLARLGLDDDTPPAALTSFKPLAEADLDAIGKAVFLSPASDSLDIAQQELGDRFFVIPGSMPLPGGSNGEISLRGTDKGSGIRAVLAHTGRDASEAVGIGDSWNDVEMFETVGTAVAMGQADPELQARADMVTTDVLDDGVFNAFVRLGLVDA